MKFSKIYKTNKAEDKFLNIYVYCCLIYIYICTYTLEKIISNLV